MHICRIVCICILCQSIHTLAHIVSLLVIKCDKKQDIMYWSIPKPNYCNWRNTEPIRLWWCTLFSDWLDMAPEYIVYKGGSSLHTYLHTFKLSYIRTSAPDESYLSALLLQSYCYPAYLDRYLAHVVGMISPKQYLVWPGLCQWLLRLLWLSQSMIGPSSALLDSPEGNINSIAAYDDTSTISVPRFHTYICVPTCCSCILWSTVLKLSTALLRDSEP